MHDEMRKRSTNEIKRAADNWMPTVLDAQFLHTGSELRVNPYHDERGIDFAIEIQQTTVSHSDDSSIVVPKRTLFVQNKGTDTRLSVRVRKPNKGRLTYHVDRAESLRYLALDHPSNVCIVTVCDLESKSLYWCPIQLDYPLYAKEIEALKDGGGVQLRIDPKRCLYRRGKASLRGFQLLLKDIENSEQLLAARQLQERSRYYAGEDAVSINVDRKKPLLEQLYQYMFERFGNLHHMPSEFFTRSYPFRSSSSFHPRQDQFTLTIDNESLIDLFKTVQILGPGKVKFTSSIWTKGVSAPQRKIRYILQRLSSSLIFYIVGHKSREWVRVRYSGSDICDCVRCRIDRMDFLGAFNALSIGITKTNNRQLVAYSHYKLGNFIEAAELLEEVRAEHKAQEEWSQYVLSSYSLSKLKIHLRSNYWEEQTPTELIERLGEIDIATICLSLPKADKNSRFHEWVEKGRFHTDTMYALYKTVDKIRDHYHSQLWGGWSSNSHIGELIKDFAELDEILNRDFMYFDRFDEYRQIVSIFSEGVFASHAISADQKSRLRHFDDWVINKIVWHSEPNRILKYFYRYHLKEVEYKPSARTTESLVVILARILDDAPTVAKAFRKLYGKTNTSFVQKYNTLVANLIGMAAISNLGVADVNVIAHKLPVALRANTLFYGDIAEHVKRFVHRKAKMIEKGALEALFRSVPKTEKLHDEGLIKVLSGALEYHGSTVLSKAVVLRFIALTTDKCPLCKHDHPSDWLIPLHQLTTNKEVKKLIQQRIVTQLKTKYEAHLYYDAVIHDVLEIQEELFNKFLLSAEPRHDQPTFRRAMSGEEDKRRPILDMFIDLCLKEAIDLKSDRFSGLRGFDDYYDWLLDMDGFDYSKFNVKWPSANQTQYYLAKMRKHEIIRTKLSEYLKEHRDPQLERVFVNLYRK